MTGRSLAIAGAGGHARVVADTAEALGWTVSLFDDSPTAGGTGPWKVVETIAWLVQNAGAFDGVVVGIGSNATRLRLHETILASGGRPCTLIHPRAWCSPHAELGAGTVMFAGSAINAGTTTGAACIINTGATVDHDCHLGEGVHISPGAHLAGGVTVGARSWVGIGAAVRQQIRIGQDAVVGAGAAVVSDVPDATTVVGTPASPLIRS